MSSRLEAFLGQSDDLCHVDFWRAVADLWRRADGAERRDERWLGLWDRARLAPGSERGLMTSAERSALEALPAELLLSRSQDDPAFAWHVGGRDEGRIAGAAARERVVALLEVRGEHELIVLPDDVRR